MDKTECIFWKEEHCDCYYKQLTLKTKECEKYKQALNEKNDFLQKLGISASGEFKRIDHYISQQNQKVEKYKQALEEINSIAGQINLTIMGGEKSPKEEWVQLYTVTVCRILQRCQEVLNDK